MTSPISEKRPDILELEKLIEKEITGTFKEENKEPEVKLCCDCKWLIGNRNRLENADLWVCGSTFNVEKKEVDLLTGEDVVTYRIGSCKNTRYSSNEVNACGPLGLWYEEYIYPEELYNRLSPDNPTPFNPVDLETVAAGAKAKIAAIKSKKLTKDDLENL